MTDPRTARLLARQRDRSIATILAFKEREVDPHLPEHVQRQLRKIVLDTLNDLTSFAVDLVAEPGVVVNDLYLEKIDAIHRAIVEEAELGRV